MCRSVVNLMVMSPIEGSLASALEVLCFTNREIADELFVDLSMQMHQSPRHGVQCFACDRVTHIVNSWFHVGVVFLLTTSVCFTTSPTCISTYRFGFLRKNPSFHEIRSILSTKIDDWSGGRAFEARNSPHYGVCSLSPFSQDKIIDDNAWVLYVLVTVSDWDQTRPMVE